MSSTQVRLAVLAAALILSPVIAAGEDNSTDLKTLEGSWDVVAIEITGKKVVVGDGSPDKIVVKDGALTIWAQRKPFAIFKDAKVELDSKKTPKAIDIVTSNGVRIPGIYEIKDKEMKLAIPRAPDKPDAELARPETFDTKGHSVVLLVTKRSQKAAPAAVKDKN